ncbi:helix-turn-helix domain-containing protein [Streptomyces tropicalis]|uniref:DUF2690 domain-containing protein n=1 Tax=Streptomyces tropicalis TaxID=3034234 RepID=A0ABT6AAX3_9ACTN|nr:XRE family transcriptional regulator [Streptomyces tropicalis]MDF3301781.1 DUF2690 domain-containing protein [Streptomyces tropicalis]
MRQPPAAAPSDEQLTACLRELRDRTGLSLAALAQRTPYSKSAWHRYLTGIKPPPRSAVEALARLAGADPARALALWETASAPGPAQGGAPVPARTGRGPLPALTVLAAVAAVVAALVAPSGSGVPGARAVMAGQRCHGRACQGVLPGASACAGDAQTRSTVADADYTVRLRYSPSCGTAWSQVRVSGAVAREVSVRAGEDALSATYSADDVRGDTSPMLAVPSPRGVEACAEVAGKLACTGLDADAAQQP